ncbi:hypothetical protein [Bdellovibrio sp. KM01]|uniref:hypothetical protein n=1 Tax=Bdellovibrio sp. KM01 TaxID=2748865 RepID=UPI001C686F00|nr:hypothetical protein [Bdellovibrio sp. KM01]
MSLTLFGKMSHMVYMIKLHKGELWRPDLLKEGVTDISVKVASGIGWVTFKCSQDLIYRPGETLDVAHKEPLIEALTEELSLEVQFKQRAHHFFGKR